MSVSRVRTVVLAAVLVTGVASGCSRVADVPRPTHTLRPATTTEVGTPTPRSPAAACSLLNSKEREGFGEKSLNTVVPDDVVKHRTECEWVHSLAEGSLESLSVEALDARDWAVRNRPNIITTANSPRTPRSMALRLRQVAKQMLQGKNLSRAAACDIYWDLTEAGGTFKRGDEVVYPAYYFGQFKPEVVSTSCIDGVYTAVIYSKYRLYPTPTLGDRVVAARKAAEARAVRRLGADASTTTAQKSLKTTPTRRP